MESELFDIYDREMNQIGVSERKEVHANGYWHKSFHCWFYQVKDGVVYLYFQKRRDDKDTFPGLFDITAAGHLTAGETVEDGRREIEEELGVKVEMEDLTFLGILSEELTQPGVKDNEFCYTYFHEYKGDMEDFKLDPVEVAGIYCVPFSLLLDLFTGKAEKLNISGFQNDLVQSTVVVQKYDFVPHREEYYQKVFAFLEGLQKYQVTFLKNNFG